MQHSFINIHPAIVSISVIVFVHLYLDQILFDYVSPAGFSFFHNSFSFDKGIQHVLFSLVFLHQVLEGDQTMTIFSFLLYYSISLYLSFHIVLCSLLFSAISHPWSGEAASVEKNQYYLQWFWWWFIFAVVL